MFYCYVKNLIHFALMSHFASIVTFCGVTPIFENYIFSVCVNHFLLKSFHKRRYKMELVYLSIHILHDPVYVAVITC